VLAYAGQEIPLIGALRPGAVSDEQLAARHQGSVQSPQLDRARGGPEEIDVHAEGDVGRVVGYIQLRECALANPKPAGGQVCATALADSLDGGFGSVDLEKASGGQPIADQLRRRTRPAAELQYPGVRAKIELFDGPSDPVGYRVLAQARLPDSRAAILGGCWIGPGA
jgi:hypothetical protein